jgi:hypothetical protein
MRDQQPSRTIPSYSAAVLTLGAAAIHFAAAPGHLPEFLPYGVFFSMRRFGLESLEVGSAHTPGSPAA